MSGCSCGGGGGGGPIIIQCGGGGPPPPGDQKPDDQKPDDQKPDDQKPDDQKPDDPPRCKVARVRFELIHVTNSGALVSVVDEPWNVFLDVNGNSATVPNPLQTQDDQSFPLGAGGEATVNLNASTVIRVQCSGEANPGVPFLDAPLPSDQKSHGPADDPPWGLGGSFTLEASNADRSYEVRYSIDCLDQRASSLISRSLAIAAVREAIEPLNKTGKVSDDAALSLFMGKISRHGFRVTGLHADDLLIEGPTDIHRFLSRLRKPVGGTRRAGSK